MGAHHFSSVYDCPQDCPVWDCLDAAYKPFVTAACGQKRDNRDTYCGFEMVEAYGSFDKEPTAICKEMIFVLWCRNSFRQA
jgi:hypothetical protein